jgi:NADH-quinone oxidoreductase subunit H
MAFWQSPVGWTLITVGQIFAVLLPVLVSLAFLIWMDRKVWAGVQMRKGPNIVGPFGLLQTFADFGKFLLKEFTIPSGADKAVFLIAPLISTMLSLGAWAVIPFAPGLVVANVNVGILYLFAVSSLGVYGIIMGGWASNSKYPFLGALRSAAQMVSYEVSLGFVIITVILLAGSTNLSEIVGRQQGWVWDWNFLGGGLKDIPLALVMLPMSVIFFISFLAETNRPPFDLPEAESELVAGYQVEYSSTGFLLFMLAEYSSIVLMCGLISILFFGGWSPGFPIHEMGLPTWLLNTIYVLVMVAKIIFWFFMVAMVKAIVPRYRYDQLMRLGWKVFLPLSLVAVAVVAIWVVYTRGGA